MMKNLIHIEDIRKRRDEFRKKQAEGDPDSGFWPLTMATAITLSTRPC
jgi:hypothetical protein